MSSDDVSRSQKHIQPETLNFLLSEYEVLKESISTEISLGETRINMFITITSGAVVLLTLMSHLAKDDITIFYITSTSILLSLLLLGLCIFARLIDRDIMLVIYTRGMNRIRHFFVEQEPSIVKYLILPIFDDTPKFYRSRTKRRVGLRHLTAIINGLIAAFLTYTLFALVFHVSSVSWQRIIVSVLSFVIVISLQEIYARSRLRSAEDSTKSQFPTNPLQRSEI